jgi:phosphoserine phosphatase
MRLPLQILLPVLLAFPVSGAGWQSRTPYHGASDAVTKPEAAVLLEAWFSRSAGLQKAVEHEAVRLDFQRGGAWEKVAEVRTDGEGHAVLAFKAPNPPGSYSLRWSLGTETCEATLHVLAPGATATVFDIDGTLTPSDREVLKDYARRLVRNPKAEGPKVRKGGVEAAQRAAKQGLVVFLTGRAPWLAHPTREWLKVHGFPEGIVLLMPETRDILPSETRVGRGKTDRLRDLQRQGLTFTAAFGNAPTDISAYEAVGLPKANTFILGKHGGERGTVALGDTFPSE